MFYSQFGARLSLQTIPSSGYICVNLTYFKGSQLFLLSSPLTLSLLAPYLGKDSRENGFVKLCSIGKTQASS